MAENLHLWTHLYPLADHFFFQYFKHKFWPWKYNDEIYLQAILIVTIGTLKEILKLSKL